MQLNCETDELRQMALLMVGEKINTLEQRIAEQEAELSRKDERLLAELNDRTCQIDKYIIQDGKKIRFGGRMSEPRNLLLK